MEIVHQSIILIVSCVLLSTASPLRENGEVVSVRLVREQSDHRVRRDAGQSAMPDVLVLQFPLDGHTVVLRLQRARYPPVYLVGSEGTRQVTELDEGLSSVYVDPSRAASFMVKKSTEGQFLLDGNLRHQGNQMEVKPVLRRKRSADNNNDNSHTVSVAVPDFIEFEHNYELDADEDLDIDLDDAAEDGEGVIESIDLGEGRRRRRRRQVIATQHTIETAFVVDHTDYAAWLTRFPTNTLTEIRSYYTYIGLTMNNIYASVKAVDPSLDIKVPITALYIVESAANAITVSATGVLEGRDYLDDFIPWIPTQPNLPPSDHYMAFTAYDVTFGGGAAVGVAESAQVCTSRSTSVVENSFRSSVANVGAHELGHTLSARHDGTSNSCPPNLQNVMTPGLFVPTQSPAVPRNIFEFSTCSVESFKSYLDGVSCTLPAQTSASVALPFTDFNYELITDRDKQCQAALNDARSFFCDPSRFTDYTEEDLCIGMLCALPDEQGRCQYVLPFEGTSCGTNKICSRGLCEDAFTVTQASATFDEPTTQAPTTQAPTTQAPTTQAPTTQAPTTQAPTTQAPTTQAPTTQAPTTQAPTTQAPTTQAPTTEAPTTEAPTTQAPTTEAPTTQAPTTQAPTTQAPTTQAPTTQAPTTEAPTTQAPTTQAPTTQAPTTEAPTTQAPTTEVPTTQVPTTQAPTTQAPTTQAPTTQAPTTEAPTTEAPTTQAPTTQAPTTQAPTTLAPTTQAPTTEAPTTQAPTTEAPTTQAPTTLAPTTLAPTTQAPTTEAPTTQAPTTLAPTTQSTTSAGEANEPATTAAPDLATAVPTTTPLPLGCVRCNRRTYRVCRWRLYLWWIFRGQFPLSPCCRACLSSRGRGRGRGRGGGSSWSD